MKTEPQHFNFFRTYDPSTGRYLEPDPVGRRTDKFDYAPALRPRSPRPLEQDVEHLYSYVDNAPTRYFDPLGLIKFDSWGTGGSFGPITFKWSSSNPLRTINEFQTDFELGGGFSFCFLPDPPCHGERPQLPADFNAGYRWLGISTNGNKLCLNLGFSLGLLPIDASIPFLESPPF